MDGELSPFCSWFVFGTKSQPMTTAWHQYSSREVVAAAEAQSTSNALPLPGWRLLREGTEAPACAGQVCRWLQPGGRG